MTSRTKKKALGPLFWAGFTVVFIGAGLAVLYAAWQDHRLATADVPSACTVVGAAVEETRRTDGPSSRDPYQVVVTLEHEVDGKAYRYTHGGPRFDIRSDANNKLLSFPAGLQTNCHYVRGRPDLVTLFAGDDERGALPFALFGAFVLLIPAFAYGLQRLPRRRGGA